MLASSFGIIPINFSSQDEQGSFFMRKALEEGEKAPTEYKIDALVVENNQIVFVASNETPPHEEYLALKKAGFKTLKDRYLLVYTTLQLCTRRSETRTHLPNCTALLTKHKIRSYLWCFRFYDC